MSNKKMKLNREALKKAKSLIESHHYVLDSDWSEAQASAEEENGFLERHDWKQYGQWYLALDTEGEPETKDHYNFPYGDFKRVHRSGLIAAKQRAAQYHYDEVEKGADELLQLLDKTKAK